MNKKEQLEALKGELGELKSQIEAEDTDAIKRAKEILEVEMPKLEESIKASEEAKAIIEQIGTPAKEQESEAVEIKNLGESCAKEFVGSFKRGERFAKSVEFKTDPTVISGPPTIYDYDKNPVNIMKAPKVTDLFGKETISNNALTFYVAKDLNGSVGTTSEGGKKNQIDFDYDTKTVALTKITGYMVETDEMMEDAPWLASAFQARLLNKLELAEENQLINGNGTAPNMTGLLNTSGIGSQTYQSTMSADDIFKAIMKVKQDSNLDADAIVINPADYQTLRLAKDSNNQYYGGGYFYGEYGNGGSGMVPPLWGLKTVLSTCVTSGTVIVGAFKQGASIVSKRGLRIEATNTNDQDFIYNRVTIRAEKREALAVRIPQAFVVVAKNE